MIESTTLFKLSQTKYLCIYFHSYVTTVICLYTSYSTMCTTIENIRDSYITNN